MSTPPGPLQYEAQAPSLQRRIRGWHRMRSLGFWRYTLLFGVLGWGLPFGLVMCGVAVCLHKYLLAGVMREPHFAPIALLSGLGGLAFGASMYGSCYLRFGKYGQ